MTNATRPVERLRSRLAGVRPKAGGGFTARCPGHDDREASLSVDPGDDGRALIHCHAGCPPERVVEALGWKPADLFPPRPGGGGPIPPDNRATVPRSGGLTLAAYAAAKRLPVGKLREWGLSGVS